MNLYSDQEIEAIYDRYVEQRSDGLLKVVPAGETKPIALIFETLGIEPGRVSKHLLRCLGRVAFYSWQVSPGFELSIMVSITGRYYGEAKTMDLDGYGVRLQEIRNGSLDFAH